MNQRIFRYGAALAMGFAVCLGAGAARAEGPFRLGADAAVVLPLGDWADGAGLGLGALARGEFAVIPSLHLIARPGYIYHLSKSVGDTDIQMSQLLVLVGARYQLGPVWAGLETGINSISTSSEGPLGEGSDTVTRFPLIISATYELDKLQAGLAFGLFNFLGKEDEGEFEEPAANGLMFNVGYTFL